VFTMRFDMRSPSSGAPTPDLYGAALDIVEWAESRGCISAMVCEHHTAGDGHLPSPTVLASAMAARTGTVPIVIAVVLLPLYDPVRLAEELRVENRSHRILRVDEAVVHVRGGAPLPLHPLIGGLPPEIAWRYLRTVVEKVMPALQG
jgi:hypothetical protein